MSYHKPLLISAMCLLISGCGQQESWERMTVTPPSGSTPEETFEEMRKAAYDRDWPKMYGCMTPEARRDQIAQLLVDVAHLAYIAETKNKYGAVPDRFRLTERQLVRAQECLNVMKIHKLQDKDFTSGPPPKGSFADERRHYSQEASYIEDADAFVRDAWDAMQDEGTALFESEAYLSDVNIMDDYAIAKVNDFWNRRGDEDSIYIHFKKVDGRWLVDLSPWWIPWGPPLHEVDGYETFPASNNEPNRSTGKQNQQQEVLEQIQNAAKKPGQFIADKSDPTHLYRVNELETNPADIEGWTIARSKIGGFEVMLPNTPMESEQESIGKSGKPFRVLAVQTKTQHDVIFRVIKVLDIEREAGKEWIEKLYQDRKKYLGRPEMKKLEMIELDGTKMIECEELSKGRYQCARTFEMGKGGVILIVSLLREPTAADREQIKLFYDSFKSIDSSEGLP